MSAETIQNNAGEVPAAEGSGENRETPPYIEQLQRPVPAPNWWKVQDEIRRSRRQSALQYKPIAYCYPGGFSWRRTRQDRDSFDNRC